MKKTILYLITSFSLFGASEAVAQAAQNISAASDLPSSAAPKLLPNGVAIADCVAPVEGMACIPGGPFLRGSDDDKHKCAQPSYNKSYYPKKDKNNKDKAANEAPAKPVYINSYPQQEIWMQTYYMDITEVTNEAYRACVKSKKCAKDGPLYADFDAAKQPITGLSWYHAREYCEAQGKHLPTEAEWEKAARGAAGELYPWGNTPEATCANSVVMDAQGRSCGAIKRRGEHPEKGRVLEVCSKGPYRYGLCDMVGNAEEWTADWYTPNYEACGEACQGINPKGPCFGEDPEAHSCGKYRHKVVRGGSWYWEKEHATAIHRRSHVPSNDPPHHFGFRCAATPEEMQKLIGNSENK